MEMLDKAAVTYQIVLTKADKISAKALAEVKKKPRQKWKTRCRLCKSSGNQFGKNIGIDELRAAISSLI